MSEETTTRKMLDGAAYSLEGKETNWYSSLPYVFKIWVKDSFYYQYLPINPSNISIQTHFATNINATLYGVVEEHSDIRFHDITIQGTTGYFPKHPTPRKGETVKKVVKEKSGWDKFVDFAVETSKSVVNFLNGGLSKGEESIGRGSAGSGGRGLSEVSAFFPKTIGIAQQAVASILGSNDARNGVPTGADGKPDFTKTGYMAFHNLQRMLFAYKKEAAAGNKPQSGHPIQFINYKDNMHYDCAPVQFSVTRSAESPMLYNYSITFRAYNLRTIDAKKVSAEAKANQLKELGLDGFGNSLAKTARGAIGKATSLMGASKSISKGLGR